MFLPTNLEEGKKYYKNFKQFDVIFINGDPYYDHPLNGVAIIARVLDSKGYKVGIIPQPENDEDYQVCGRPKLFFCISSGLLDSMLANYTPMLKKRENVIVPERALQVYTQKIKSFYKGCMTILGGLEANIRRFTHFDYRTNKLRPGILHDTKANLLIFGNERAILTILKKIKKTKEAKTDFENFKDSLDLKTIPGIAYRIKKEEVNKTLPSFEDCEKNKESFSELNKQVYLNPESSFIEPCGLGFIQHNENTLALTEEEMDYIYELPFTRELHPKTKRLNELKAHIQKLKNSVIIGRGCWGSCSFCILPLVQGKQISQRSKESIIKEVREIYERGDRIVSDLTMPTMNMYGSKCLLYNIKENMYSPILQKDITIYRKVKSCDQNCIKCPNRKISNDLLFLIKDIEKYRRNNPRNILELRSAVRHDIILQQKNLLNEILNYVTRLKIAPEHITKNVLNAMNKSDAKTFVEFLYFYKSLNPRTPLVPYFIAAHPGSTMKDMESLKEFCEKYNLKVNLTQIFTPTPGTLSTCMYYTGENPLTKEKVYVPRTFREKKDQKNILFSNPELVDDNA